MFNIICILLFVSITNGHLVGDKAHMAELKKLCEHAYNCIHDAVNICGRSVTEERTFLDLCDLYEYSCEHNMVYTHTRDVEGCPNPKYLEK